MDEKGRRILVVQAPSKEKKMRMLDTFFNIHQVNLAEKGLGSKMIDEERSVYTQNLISRLDNPSDRYSHPKAGNKIIQRINHLFKKAGLCSSDNGSHSIAGAFWKIDLDSLYMDQCILAGELLPARCIPDGCNMNG
jgi:hypothetical protein